MSTVTIFFQKPDGEHAYMSVYENVVRREVHTYGFLELEFADGSIEEFNMSSIRSYKWKP